MAPHRVAALDPQAILNAFSLSGVRRISPVTGGADTAIWRVETHGDAYALRVFRPEQTYAVRREVAAMRAAREGGLPVPAIHGEAVWQDRPALLLSWMPGQPLRDVAASRPWHAWALGVAFGQAQARIHQLRPPATLVEDRHAWIDLATPGDALRAMLHAVSGERVALLHLDYHPMNVLVAERRVTGILDWSNTRAGDGRADLARTDAILRFGPMEERLPRPLAIGTRNILRAGWRCGYKRVAGPMRGMAPFYAWAGAFMARDLGPRLGREDLPWLTVERLDEIRAWSEDWQRYAEGLASAPPSS